MAEKESKVIEFKKCRVCGSTNRYCESLGNQEKAREHKAGKLTTQLESCADSLKRNS